MPATDGISRRALLGGAIGLGAAGAITLRFDIDFLAGAAKAAESLSSWIRIGADGRVTVFTGKAEIGQGILTALVQIAADELDVDPARVEIVSADTARTPDEGYTFGSLSVSKSGMAIRRAAAELRLLLLERAAARLAVDLAVLTVEDGEVRAGAARTSYAEIARDLPAEATATGRAEPKAPAERRLAGRSMERVDIAAKVFAEGRFLHDLRLPGMLHGRILRPSREDARPVAFDRDLLAALPEGVRTVIDGGFVGVVAEREEHAIRAVETLREAAREQGGASLPDEADLPTLIREHPGAKVSTLVEEGDAPAAGRRIAARYTRPYQAHAAIGPSLALARFDEDGALTVWTHSQGVFPLRGALAEALGLPEEKVRVIHGEGAGCYGHNGADDAALDAALLARAVPGRPVRLQWMREDEFLREPYGSAMVNELSGVLDEDGRLLALEHDVHGFSNSARPDGRAGNLLAARRLARPFPALPAVEIPQPNGGLDRNAVAQYRAPYHRVAKHFIADSPLRVSALRGLGAYGNVFAIESFIDELAHAAGLDPVEFRLARLDDPRARAVIEAARDAASAHPPAPGGGRGMAWARYKGNGGYFAVVVEVAVDRGTGAIRLLRAESAVDCGEIVNPDGVRNQVEGGILQSASWTLYEAVRFDGQGIVSRDWASYPILTFENVPQVSVHLLDRPEAPPLGAGEVAQGPMAAAIANAVFAATGARLRDLPFTPDRVLAALG